MNIPANSSDARKQLELEAPSARYDSGAATLTGLPSTNSAVVPVAPLRIGDYRIIRKLGEGGMGVVYEAEQQHPRRPVALKVIRGGQFVGEYHVQLFQREVQALALLKHPGIAAIYDAGQTEDGQHYFAMELAPGAPLMEYVKQRSAQPDAGELRQRLEMFLKLADAISYAHQRGVIHRDLKPANILASDGTAAQTVNSAMVSRGEIKVLDFGLARITAAEEAGGSQLSAVGQIKGTLAYMSPEQVRGNPDEIDVRTDVYALGMILYELLAERLPYDVERASLPEALRTICEEPPKSLSQTWNETHTSRKSERLDRDVETIVLKALEKDPNRRYQAVAAMAEDVTRYLTNQPITARPPSAVYQFRKLVARHKALFAFLGALFVLLLGFGVTMAVQSARIARERDKAVAAEQMAATQRDTAERARGVAIAAQNAAEQARKAEEEQRLAAETNLALANEQRTRAEQGELASRQLVYASQMKLAQVAWDENRLGQMTELLERQRPQPGQADLRGFEWHYLWRLSNREVMRFEGHKLTVRAVAFAPDGKHLASGSIDGSIKLWDVATGQELFTRMRHTQKINPNSIPGVHAIAFSPDGKRFVTSGADALANLWAAVTGQELLMLKGHTGVVTSIAFSPDGKRLASGSGDGTSKLWDAATGEELHTLNGGGVAVRSVAFSPNSQQLATGSASGAVKIWNVATGQELPTFQEQNGRVTSIAFSSDGKRLAISAAGKVKLIDAATGRELTPLTEEAVISSVAFSPDGNQLAAGSQNGIVRLWDVANGQVLQVIKAEGVRALAFSPDGKRLATCGGHTVRLWALTGGPEPFVVINRPQGKFALSADSRRIVGAAFDNNPQFWDAITGQKLLTFPGNGGVRREDKPLEFALSPNGKLLATRTSEIIKLWNAGLGRELLTVKAQPGSGNYSTNLGSGALFFPDSKRLALGNGNGDVTLREASTGKELGVFKGLTTPVRSLALSPDGKRLAAGSTVGEVSLWDAVTRQELGKLRGLTAGGIDGIAFSPDGKRLALCNAEFIIRLFDVGTLQEITTLKGHGGSVTSVAFSPDGKRLASSSRDGTVRLWDLATGQELLTLKGATNQGGVIQVAFSPDGKRLAASGGGGGRGAGGTGTLTVWSAASDGDAPVRRNR